MSEAGAGLGIFVQYMGQALPVLLINQNVLEERNFFLQQPESRLKSWNKLTRQDRSVNTLLFNEDARTTDKGFLTFNEERMIYSLNFHYK